MHSIVHIVADPIKVQSRHPYRNPKLSTPRASRALWTPRRGCVIHCVCMTQTAFKAPLGGIMRQAAKPEPIKVRYCLYARKSTEEEDKQALSIESQVREMTTLAVREGLEIVEIKRESHASKEVGQRPVYNQLLDDLRCGKFNGILTWAPDRLSRNAGDLGAVVDLLDQKKLVEIRTYTQTF